jgi:hypothetical protein
MSAAAICAICANASSLRAVQNVKVELILILDRNELDAQLPLGVAAGCDGIEEVASVVIRVLSVYKDDTYDASVARTPMPGASRAVRTQFERFIPDK